MGRRGLLSHKLSLALHPVPSFHLAAVEKDGNPKKTSLALEKRDWENATCSVCMEFPHNAVLLLCSSHDKGCRPYMCATSYRYSNCLDQFKKAYTKEAPAQHKSAGGNASLGLALPRWPACGKSNVMELSCPLCRGQVKGWTVVEPAREYLNKKRRICVQDNCSFKGTYKKLRKHVRADHASAKPHKVDPVLEQKWKMLEYQREREDVMSTIRSSMPSSIVMGDYVIDMSDSDLDTDDDEDEYFERLSRRRISRRENFRRGSNRRFSRSILHVLVRDSTRLARFNRDEGLPDSLDEGVGHSPDMAGGGAADVAGAAAAAAANVAGVFSSEEDYDEISYGDLVRTERRERQRHGRSLYGVS